MRLTIEKFKPKFRYRFQASPKSANYAEKKLLITSIV